MYYTLRNGVNKRIDSVIDRMKYLGKLDPNDEAALKQGGMANNQPLSARAAGFIICGHEIHHKNVIEERYL